MPKYQSNVDAYYRPIENDRREAHKDTFMVFKFPLACMVLLGGSAMFLAWVVNKTIMVKASPENFVYTFSAAVPFFYLIYFIAWWLRELTKLNRDAKPLEQTYNPNPGLRRDWVRTVEGHSAHDRAIFLHADDIQLAAIARHVQSGRPFNVTELAPYFGGNRAAVQTFYGDLASSKSYNGKGELVPLGEWVNPNDHKAGFRLLQEGIDHLYSKLPTPLPQENGTPVYGRNPLYIQDTEEEE